MGDALGQGRLGYKDPLEHWLVILVCLLYTRGHMAFEHYTCVVFGV